MREISGLLFAVDSARDGDEQHCAVQYSATARLRARNTTAVSVSGPQCLEPSVPLKRFYRRTQTFHSRQKSTGRCKWKLLLTVLFPLRGGLDYK